MSLQPLIPYLASLLVLSAGAMTWAASGADKLLSLAAAVVFASAVCAAALYVNRVAGWPAAALAEPDAQVHAARRNARLMALTYAWGGLALLAVYKLTGLRWQHGWQYGSGMAVIAGLLLIHVHVMGDDESWWRSRRGLSLAANAALMQALAILVGLALLVTSGKLWTGRNDWAANQVFVVGGLTLAVVSLIAWRTHQVLAARSG